LGQTKLGLRWPDKTGLEWPDKTRFEEPVRYWAWGLDKARLEVARWNRAL